MRNATLGLARVARDPSQGEVAGVGTASSPAGLESSCAAVRNNEAAVLPVKTCFDRPGQHVALRGGALFRLGSRRGVAVRIRPSHRRELRPMQWRETARGAGMDASQCDQRICPTAKSDWL